MDESAELASTAPILSGIRIRQKTHAGHMHVIVAVDMGTRHEVEVFAQVGKAGGIPLSNLEAICRMISLFLRTGGSLEAVVEQLEGIGAGKEQIVLTREGRVISMGDALAKALKRYLEAKEKHGLEALLMGEVDFEKETEDEQQGQGHPADPGAEG